MSKKEELNGKGLSQPTGKRGDWKVICMKRKLYHHYLPGKEGRAISSIIMTTIGDGGKSPSGQEGIRWGKIFFLGGLLSTKEERKQSPRKGRTSEEYSS